jgi:alpha-L-fucosidase
MEIDKAQLKELLTNYGKIDVMFFDGPAEGLKEYAWQLQPELVVTRGQMKTPEQRLPDAPIPGPWEACFTMGTDWQYKPTNDPHKSGTQIINMLIETRAKGGNLLLNVGPKPDGEIQIEQEALLREVALWNLVNGEAVHAVRPWDVIKEDGIWFTQAKSGDAVYAFVQTGKNWPYGTRKKVVIKGLEKTDQTKISVLGYGSKVVEYRKNFDAGVRVNSVEEGLEVSAVNGLRLYTNNQWPNPVVLKIENVRSTRAKSTTSSNQSAKGETQEIDGLQ